MKLVFRQQGLRAKDKRGRDVLTQGSCAGPRRVPVLENNCGWIIGEPQVL
jgi:hypothetical protein